MQWPDIIPILALLRFVLLLCLLNLFLYHRQTILLYFLLCDCIVNSALHLLRRTERTFPTTTFYLRLVSTWNAIGLVLYGILIATYAHTPPLDKQHETRHYETFGILLIILKIAETAVLSDTLTPYTPLLPTQT
jgi:hypothetical protein